MFLGMTIWEKSVSSGFLIRHLNLLYGVGNHSDYSRCWHIRDKRQFFYTFVDLVDIFPLLGWGAKNAEKFFDSTIFLFRRCPIKSFLQLSRFFNHFKNLLKLGQKSPFNPAYAVFPYKTLFFTSLQILAAMEPHIIHYSLFSQNGEFFVSFPQLVDTSTKHRAHSNNAVRSMCVLT